MQRTMQKRIEMFDLCVADPFSQGKLKNWSWFQEKEKTIRGASRERQEIFSQVPQRASFCLPRFSRKWISDH